MRDFSIRPPPLHNSPLTRLLEHLVKRPIQVAAVGPRNQPPAIGAMLHPVEGRIRQREITRRIQRLASRGTMNDIEHTAMGEYQHTLAAMAHRQRFKPSRHARRKNNQRFAILVVIVRRPRMVVTEYVRILHARFL